MDKSEDKDLIDDIRRMNSKTTRYLASLTNALGSFELRAMDWLVPFGMVVLNGDRPKGSVSIGMHPIYLPTPRDTRRILLVDSAISTTDFTCFGDQFNGLWNGASPFSSSQEFDSSSHEA